MYAHAPAGTYWNIENGWVTSRTGTILCAAI